MCLFTKYIKNKKYVANKKNRGNPPECKDKRTLYVPVSCGKCIECRKRKQREWCIRLSEEIRTKKAWFITLTIDNQSFEKERQEKDEDFNETATRMHRKMLERIRKKNGKSIKHWAITELGGDNGRGHIHGIYFCENPKTVTDEWKYGFVFTGTYVNEKTIFYITKYMLKKNEHDPNFIGKVLASAGIGNNYTKRADSKNNEYKPNNRTDETYRLRSGIKIGLPQYYRNKIYSEEERERLWIEKQEREYRYVGGEKIPMDDEKTYENLLSFYQRRAAELYGDNPEEWNMQRHLKAISNRRKYLRQRRG